MTHYQVLLFPLAAAAIAVLGGALHPKSAAGATRAVLEVDAALPNDPQTIEFLDKAAAALAPRRMPWLECRVWQQALCEDFCYRGSGRILTAPGGRCRFDLNVKVGKTLGELRVVADGKALWRSLRLASDKPAVLRWELPVGKAGQAAEEVEAARFQFFRNQGFAGVGALLLTAREKAKGARHLHHQWNGRDVILVCLAVDEEKTAPTVGLEVVVPRFHLKQCCLYLDAQTLWPHRVEWWGAEKLGQPNRLVVQTEYPNPVFNQPLSPERCAAEFSFDGAIVQEPRTK